MIGKAPEISGCEWLASQRGWELKRGSVMVEGTSDVAYFNHASKLYESVEGRRLLDEDFSIFAAGMGSEGGTFGISERFPTLFELASIDAQNNPRRKYTVIALVDDDRMGQAAAIGISKGHRAIIEYEVIFRLRRKMPLRAGSVRVLEQKTKEVNAEYGNLECVIEDLLSLELHRKFQKNMPHALKKPSTHVGAGAHHYLTDDGKRELLKFTITEATIDDLQPVVDVIKSLRSYVGLPPSGST
ncbi:TPA: hypothetical protein ACKRVK_002846 [Pseudomonas aeruginosa]|uniref:hypothetical protein n=1 Tax=Pseudomonas aeruginosa TaxID=287 RepID=UPI0012DAAAFF|nr:hypothetical protein [Pseudomonas aeruginosa]EKJ9724478.1 hypothetical protein [Pseudomonas aeruginosa]EKW8363066.1 hypothetical protein [Pseudomonas aeruginosa]MUJ03436.1 hypothetical protein [Pseudomonas aeruginosa]QKE69216.1 hypothetical protein HP562_18845 [Pseudomonas aeruginosa]HEH9915914.1 hypothetical protein [Pseudomonas aeruginosa]